MLLRHLEQRVADEEILRPVVETTAQADILFIVSAAKATLVRSM